MNSQILGLAASATLGLLAPLALRKSMRVQLELLPTLCRVSSRADRGAFRLPLPAAAQLDSARIKKVIIEKDGSGIALRSASEFFGFWDLHLSKAAQRVVLVKHEGEWIVKRDSRDCDIKSTLESLAKTLSEHAPT